MGAHHLSPAPQGNVFMAQFRESGDLRVHRVLAVEVGHAGGVAGAEQCLVVVARHLAGEQVLARGLVHAMSDEPLLIARIDHWHAPQQEHHGVAQHHTLRQFVVAHVRIRVADHPGQPAEVMIAGESRQAQAGDRPTFVENVVFVHAGQHGSAGVLAQQFPDRSREPEVEHGR